MLQPGWRDNPYSISIPMRSDAVLGPANGCICYSTLSAVAGARNTLYLLALPTVLPVHMWRRKLTVSTIQPLTSRLR